MTSYSAPVLVGWVRCVGFRLHLRKSKEVFDAELYVLVQALKTLESRGTIDRDYRIVSGSKLVLWCIQMDE